MIVVGPRNRVMCEVVSPGDCRGELYLTWQWRRRAAVDADDNVAVEILGRMRRRAGNKSIQRCFVEGFYGTCVYVM